MNKKIFFLVMIQISFFGSRSFAQVFNPCYGTTINCIQNPDLINSLDWYPSHGSLNVTANNAPLSTAGSGALRMWSIYNMGSGVFTCFDFQPNVTYRVCFWVRNVTAWPSNPFGKLNVYAAGVIANNTGTPGNVTLPWGPVRQLIDDSYYGPAQFSASYPSGAHPWQFVSFTFVPDSTYSTLWFYPETPMGPPPAGPIQYEWMYEVEIDDIRVTTETPFTVSVNANINPIDFCNGSAQLTITGMPTGTVATWSPTPNFINVNDGSVVTVSPCSTTTYKAVVTDPASTCATCIRKELEYTVIVNPWSDPLRISYPSTVPCGGDIDLEYVPDPTNLCPQINTNHYIWRDPDGNTYSGIKYKVKPATAYHTGEWTLEIINPSKGCSEFRTFFITVGSCCISNPSFTTSGCNPVTFTNNSTGITNLVGVLWNFGDGTTSDLFSPIHTYNVTGARAVCLTMLYSDGQGETCCNRICSTIQVCSNPRRCIVSANFSITPKQGLANTFDFQDLSTGSGVICDYYWDFGDGNTAQQTPAYTHTYTSSGPWFVCLTATNCITNSNGAQVTCDNKKCQWVYPGTMVVPAGTKYPYQDREGKEAISLGIADENPEQVHVYPNPAGDHLMIELPDKITKATIILMDAKGKEILSREISENNYKLNLPNLSDGIYMLRIKGENLDFMKKIQIVNNK